MQGEIEDLQRGDFVDGCVDSLRVERGDVVSEEVVQFDRLEGRVVGYFIEETVEMFDVCAVCFAETEREGFDICILTDCFAEKDECFDVLLFRRVRRYFYFLNGLVGRESLTEFLKKDNSFA